MLEITPFYKEEHQLAMFIDSSVADPDPLDTDPDPAFHFDMDPDPAFQFDTDLDLTVGYRSESLPFQRGTELKQYRQCT
jgi:hypothetical protein